MQLMPEQSVHLILSDIPYGIGIAEWDVLHNNTNSAFLGNSPAQRKTKIFQKRGKPLNGWSIADRTIPSQYYEWCKTWTPLWFKILKPGGSAIVFAGRRLSHRFILAMEDVGFILKDQIAWIHNAPHRAQRISKIFDRRKDKKSAETWKDWRVGNLRPVFEPILWFFKPYKKTIADNVISEGLGHFNQIAYSKYSKSCENVLKIVSSEKKLHPTQKPLKLMQAIIELTTCENQVVFDPFAGSGTTLVAAKILNRKFLGTEINEEYYQIAQNRLAIVKVA